MEQKPIFNGFKYTTSNFPDKDSSPDSVFYTTVYKLVQGIPQYLSMTITDLKDFEFLFARSKSWLRYVQMHA